MILKCKMCGGDMEYTQGASVMECPYCGTNQTLPKVDDERLGQMHSRANHLRLMKEFDKAQMIYEEIIAENPKDAEAHWCALLCRYGIEYVEDPYSRERKPTMHRTQFDAITEDAHYLAALEHADSVARALYEHEAQLIDRIRRRYLSIASKEEPFDVFICYKETGADGQRTKDSVYAQEIYNELTREGYKVFFARITLEDKLGEAYEPYIFAALGSARVMLVVGTSAAHMQAEWVKNEWKRYLYLMKQDSKKKLIPVYRDMEAYDMPEEFVYMQAQDYGKIGALQDLVRGVEKIVGKKQAAQSVVQPVQQVVQQQGAGVESLMRRAQLFLEDGDWKSANEYLDKVLDIDPEYAPAYFGKVMARYHVCKEEQFAKLDAIRDDQFELGVDWQKVLRFADAAQKRVYVGYFTQIQQRRDEKAERESREREEARICEILEKAKKRLNQANTVEDCNKVKECLKEIESDSRAKKLIEECDRKIEKIREAYICEILEKAKKYLNQANTVEDCNKVKEYLKEIERDPRAKKLIEECDLQIEKICEAYICEILETAKTRLSQANVIAEYDKAVARVEYNEIKKQLKVIQQDSRAQELIRECDLQFERVEYAAYEDALNRMQMAEMSAQFRDASQCFSALNGYRDSKKLMQECEEKAKQKLAEEKQREEDRCEQQRIIDERNKKIKATKAKKRIAALVLCLIIIGLYVFVIVPGMHYNKAEKLLAAGDGYAAVEAFMKAGTYSDAQNRVYEAYYSAGQMLEQQNNPLMAALAYRKSGRKDALVRADELIVVEVAAGRSHTVGLKSDGTVVARGYNEYGQCDVSSWKDIVAVSAGDYHTVGLKSDGTVVAVGYNEFDQCDISSWKDIVAVSAGDSYTVGLKSDGTVVAVGYNKYGQCNVSSWKDIVAVSAGAAHTVGLKSGGTVVAVGYNGGGRCDVSSWKEIVAVSAVNHTVGLKSDGTVVAVGYNEDGKCDVSSWTGIVAVSAGHNTVGLKSDGTVVATSGNIRVQCDVSGWKDIVAVSAGYNHTVGLKSDGTVVAVGDNDDGQCNVGDWNLSN